MCAYTKALEFGITEKNINILSLGTGDYVPDPLHPDLHRNLLFWAVNNETVTKVIFDGPQNNLDIQLSTMLNQRYQRWQSWFDKPIGLDDIRQESIDVLVNTGLGYFEEMIADDDNKLNSCLERLTGQKEFFWGKSFNFFREATNQQSKPENNPVASFQLQNSGNT